MDKSPTEQKWHVNLTAIVDMIINSPVGYV